MPLLLLFGDMSPGPHGADRVGIIWNGLTMTPYVTELGILVTAVGMEKATTLGQTWEQSLATGLFNSAPLVLSGFYDDTAPSGPNQVWGVPALAGSHTLQVSLDSARSFSVGAIVESYRNVFKVGTLTRYTVTLQPSGPVTEG